VQVRGLIGLWRRVFVQPACNIAYGTAGSYTEAVTTSWAEPDLPLLDEQHVLAHRDELVRLAGSFGVSDLRFASAGRLVGRVADDKDLLDVVGFDLAVEELLGARVSLFSDRVLVNDNVSQDLVDARPL
jgi:hypothetical protein